MRTWMVGGTLVVLGCAAWYLGKRSRQAKLVVRSSTQLTVRNTKLNVRSTTLVVRTAKLIVRSKNLIARSTDVIARSTK